jgi:CPA2 family monovalent cation:H+ antiporter-2/glutathione-regulated potassium-efflux system protein KefB
MLTTLVPLLAAAVIAVPISRRLGLGSIVGYLVAGVLIGPAGLRLVTDVDQIADVSELGVVMLLFLIGLELRPHRLWVLRKAIFGLGLGQVVPSALALAGVLMAFGVAPAGAVVLGVGLAFSSTAIVLPMLTERGLLSGMSGRDTFAVLLFQDMAFIPVVAAVPLLAHHETAAHLAQHLPWPRLLRGVCVIAAILIGGARLVPIVFRLVGGAKTPEVFTAVTLLLVAGTAALADWAGLSMSLGAFMAGVVLSDSDYRHELQANVEPFEGLLLGFFFTSVGMSADLGLALRQPGLIAGGVAVLLVVKIAIAFVVGLIKRGNTVSAARFAIALPEGSEFSFVLFAAAVGAGSLAKADANAATLVVAVSMFATPVLFAASERFLIPRLGKPKEPVYDAIDDGITPVIVCGFGRVGQIVGRILALQKIPYTALEKDEAQLEVLRRFGTRVFFGDASRLEVLRAAGAETARVLVVAVDGVEDTLRVVELARRHFPNLAVYARARNRRHAHRLMDLGVDGLVRETFFSSLRLAEVVLTGLDIAPAEARRTVQIFRERDERSLEETHAYANDESQLIQNSQQVAAELQGILEADRVPSGAVPGALAALPGDTPAL